MGNEELEAEKDQDQLKSAPNNHRKGSALRGTFVFIVGSNQRLPFFVSTFWLEGLWKAKSIDLECKCEVLHFERSNIVLPLMLQ